MQPEHRDWKPWFVRMVEFGGEQIVLDDAVEARRVAPLVAGHGSPAIHRYALLSNVVSCPVHRTTDCGARPIIAQYDDLAEAIAAFFAAEERLREGVLA